MRRSHQRALWGLLPIIAAPIIIASYQALHVRRELLSADLQIRQAQTDLHGENWQRAEPDLSPIMRSFDQAVEHTDSVSWTLTEHLPFVGGNFRAVRNVALAAQMVGVHGFPEFSRALVTAQRGELLGGNQIDLKQLDVFQVNALRASNATSRALRLLDERPNFLLPNVARGFDRARLKLFEADKALTTAEGTLRLAPVMLGKAGPRRYLLVVQNNAEARATGGLIGAFGLLRIVNGHLSMEQTGVNSELRGSRQGVSSAAGAAEIWLRLGANHAWYDANYTPHFPDAARNFAGLWEAQTGEKVDGVVAIDPVVMSELLRATGSIKLSDGVVISSDNVVSFVSKDEYFQYPDPVERKQVLRRLADELFTAMTSRTEPKAALTSFFRASRSGHLFVWSRHANEQASIARGSIGGALPITDDAFLMILTQNFGGNKLDYYLHRRIQVTRIGRRQIAVEVQLRNPVPPGLPAYITVRSDHPTPPVPYGQAKIGLSVYGAKTSEISSVTIDGHRTSMAFDHDHGHRMGTCILELPANTLVTINILMSQPEGELHYRPQPLIATDALDFQGNYRIGVR